MKFLRLPQETVEGLAAVAHSKSINGILRRRQQAVQCYAKFMATPSVQFNRIEDVTRFTKVNVIKLI